MNDFFHQFKGPQAAYHHYRHLDCLLYLLAPAPEISLILYAAYSSSKLGTLKLLTSQTLTDFQGIKSPLCEKAGSLLSFSELQTAWKSVLDSYLNEYRVILTDLSPDVFIRLAVKTEPVFKTTPPSIVTKVRDWGEKLAHQKATEQRQTRPLLPFWPHHRMNEQFPRSHLLSWTYGLPKNMDHP